jgi:hypothetical protein
VTALVRAELLKVRTTRAPYFLALAGVLLSMLGVLGNALTAGQQTLPPLTDPAMARTVYASAGGVTSLIPVIGILIMTTEYRFMTVTSTFLVTPRRGRVVTAKMVAAALVSALIGAVSVILSFALAAVILSVKTHAAVPATTQLQIAGGVLLSCALYGILGVSVGALIKNQVAAVVVALVWTFVVEALVVALLPSVGKWLPAGANNAILQGSRPGASFLPVWGGALVLVGYAVVLALVAARTTLRRDVT